MLLNVIYFLAGLFLIIKGADWLTDGASSIARRFNVPSLIIGLTIVAFGTSAPELVVSVISSIEGKSDLAIGNVVGSNMFNTLAIAGLTALIYPIKCHKSTINVDLPVCIFASVLLLLMVSDTYIWGNQDVISRLDSFILLIIFIVFIIYLIKSSQSQKSKTLESNISEDKSSIEEMSIIKAVLLFIIGLGCLIFGGDRFVDGASGIALGLGISQSTIALTIVAAGTSFPELVTSIIAARKGDTDMALGNIIGSNIFNILMILGISGIISPLSLGSVNHLNMILLVVSSVMMFIFGKFGKKHHYITRSEGIFLTILAICYYIYIVMFS